MLWFIFFFRGNGIDKILSKCFAKNKSLQQLQCQLAVAFDVFFVVWFWTSMNKKGALIQSSFQVRSQNGLLWELNPGPLAPEARIMPLDQAANATLRKLGCHKRGKWYLFYFIAWTIASDVCVCCFYVAFLHFCSSDLVWCFSMLPLVFFWFCCCGCFSLSNSQMPYQLSYDRLESLPVALVGIPFKNESHPNGLDRQGGGFEPLQVSCSMNWNHAPAWLTLALVWLKCKIAIIVFRFEGVQRCCLILCYGCL